MDSKRLDKSESSTKSTDYPGMWQVPRNFQHCCIYRVPNSIRRVNPEAYTPQLVLIGPLNHSLKSQARKSRGDVTNAKSMGYLNMEAHKKFYLAEFAKRFDGEKVIDGFKRIIEENEKIIRESYSESTAWIESSEFVEMILDDSVFIMEFILRLPYLESTEKIGDPLMDEPCLMNTVYEDLMLLENQLPYFILEKLFDPIIPSLSLYHQSLRPLILTLFGCDDKVRNSSEFKHFTDLIRCVRVETLEHLTPKRFKGIEHMYNMEKLNSGGVEFEAVKEEFPFYVRFENGCLKIPCLRVFDDFERTLRNLMALEQCHYPFSAHICNYFIFLDYLIDTDKDVDLLVKKGIIRNYIGENRLVAEMVNKLCMGMVNVGSYHSYIADRVIKYYEDPFNKVRAAVRNDLKSVYFSSLLKGTATVAAMLLLIMTLIQTVASIIQVMQNAP